MTLKIIFMGTPHFAIPSLQKLLDEPNFEVVAVYSKEPKISGRGHKVQNSQIHNLALKNNIEVFTPKTLRNEEVQKEFANLKADIGVVVAYGLILPKEILSAPKLGCINIHPSLLPRWRGAAPLQRSLMAGDKQTGVDIIQMDEGMDSGDILECEKFDLDDQINCSELSEKAAKIGADLLIKTIKKLVDGKANPIKQDDEMAIYASKILKDEFAIDWNNCAKEIHNKIRGLSGSGSAYFELHGEKIKIHKAKIISESNPNFNAGEILDDKLTIACQDGSIRPEILQRAGKNRVALDEFLRGFDIQNIIKKQ
ncbi:MAG: methionyl-tRNA formyltransferase [Rickettsiales bacterium]|jgi:methionyl-tRNA formyltransferase